MSYVLRLFPFAHDRRREPRLPGSATLRITAASVGAYVLAGWLPGEQQPLVAALTALLVVQLTLFETLRSGRQRVASVLAGVLLAVLLSAAVGLTWWSLGLLVLASLVVGQRLSLGPQLLEVPISAMLVLAVSSSTQVGLDRVYETLLGAGVGVLVNVLLPPVHVRPAREAIGAVAAEVAGLLRAVAVDLERDWTPERAAGWLRRARALEGTVQAGRDALARAEDSVRLNPRARGTAHEPETLASGLTALEYAAIDVRVICRTMLERVEDRPHQDLPEPPMKRSVAQLLSEAAAAVGEFGRLMAPAEPATQGTGTGRRGSEEELRRALMRAAPARDIAGRALLVDGPMQPDLWRLHGILLSHIDRLLAEVDPDTTAAAAAALRRPAAPAGWGARMPVPAPLRHLVRR